MNKTLKRAGKGLLALSLLVGTGAGLTGCGGNNTEAQVMTLSVNPGIEFIVDEDDKVISVTASNEDGAYILERYTEFTGMSAKDAALKFLELAETYGFVVEGFTDGDTITISVSGDGAEKLYNDVKGKIQEKATDLGLTVGSMVKIAETKLEEIIGECYQEYTEAEIKAFDEEKLLELLQQSREETEGLFTDEQRFEYYQERAKKIVESKVTAINDYVEEHGTTDPMLAATINAIMQSTIPSQVTGLYNALTSQLESAQATLNSLVETYTTAKKAYLDAVAAYRTALESADETAIAQARDTMLSLKEAAETAKQELETQRATLKAELMEAVKDIVESQEFKGFMNSLNGFIDDIEEKGHKVREDIGGIMDSFKEGFGAGHTSPWGQH